MNVEQNNLIKRMDEIKAQFFPRSPYWQKADAIQKRALIFISAQKDDKNTDTPLEGGV